MDRILHINFGFFSLTETFVRRIVENIRKYEVILGGFWMNENAKKYRCRKVFIKMPKPSMYLFCDGFIKYKITRIIKEEKIALVHAHFGETGAIVVSYKEFSSVPLVVSFYGRDASATPVKKIWSKRYKKLFNDADKFIVEGPAMKEKLIALGCPKEKIEIIRIGVDVEGLLACFKKQDKGKIRIVFAGRLVEKKGIMDALEVVKILKEDKENFEFLIIGDGPLRKKVEEFIKANKLYDTVKTLGNIPYEKYLQILSTADIYFQPSCIAKDGDSEGGAPTTIIEAQAMGIPVVSTYHADIPFVTLFKKTAFLEQEHDVVAMAKDLRKLMHDVKLRIKMGKNGAEFVKKYHSIHKMITEIQRLYGKLLK